MKQNIKKSVFKILYFFSCIFSRSLSAKLSLRFNQLYSMWLLREFNAVGEDFLISSPLYLHGGKYITIGEGFSCQKRLHLHAFEEVLGDKFTPEIKIGNHVSIQHDCHIGAINKIIIGNNVLLASKVYITDHFHGEITKEALLLPPSLRKLFSKGPVIIEDNVWLGEGVVVLPGVTIGENSIVGANAVVTRSIPRNCVAAGNPARVVRELA
ncbi:acetyltransferase-like isoleucine patch superfamily enzyme [Flavobacterium sp. CG_23.5]|uniref:acyltransferase n=1 Tax=Flavobacterium sp. CG_23.5 TaxID=2760708 RepID=UPI001EBC46BE|nr:acyltransferase [Flavobacterium sp. CG_23.5]MBP2283104.1 acetyltransferase-like isoleucine patch superfamily enzyme [Flavobacterium sp. CG_23.5]